MQNKCPLLAYAVQRLKHVNLSKSHPDMLLSRQQFVEPYSVRVYPHRRRLRLNVQLRAIRGVCRRAQQQEDASRDSESEFGLIERFGVWKYGPRSYEGIERAVVL